MSEPASRPAGVLGALGGPYTFGGQAARAMAARSSDFEQVAYLDRSSDLFADNGQWRVNAACVPAFTSQTGPHLNTHRRLAARNDLHVMAEVRHAYHCALLVRPGTPQDRIVRILGHTGSINQSRPWLEQAFPTAEIVVVDSHSLGAAREVASGDGTLAAVGSIELAADSGLDILARDIDGGSVGFYWALAPGSAEPVRPNRVVLAGRTQDGHGLTVAVCRLADVGFNLIALNQMALGDGLFHTGCVAYFQGAGDLDEVRRAVPADDGLRLAGVYTAPEDP